MGTPKRPRITVVYPQIIVRCDETRPAVCCKGQVINYLGVWGGGGGAKIIIGEVGGGGAKKWKGSGKSSLPLQQKGWEGGDREGFRHAKGAGAQKVPR